MNLEAKKGTQYFDAGNQAPKDVPECDLDRFRPFLAEAEMTKEHQDEFLLIYWNIIASFVDMGFGIHDLQQVCSSGGATVDLSAYLFSDDTETCISNEENQNAEISNILAQSQGNV